MKIPKRKPKPETDLEAAIHDAHAFLKGEDDDSKQYRKTVDNLAKLYKMKESEVIPNRVSKDAIVAASASVGAVVMIILFEAVGRGMITSKSLGFVHKPKI